MIKFGTDGWRAVISDEFTFENVKKVAFAISSYLKNSGQSGKTVIFGYDARFLADKFAETAANIFMSQGFNCLIADKDTPTPVIAWQVLNKKACGALMFTASHNPPQYCGIKFIPDYAGPANEGITKQIEAELAKNTSVPQCLSASVPAFDPKPEYFAYIKKFFDAEAFKKSKLKIVVNPMFGSGRGYLSELLKNYGCEVIEINNYRDVLFGGHNPEPEAETCKDLIERVKEQKADLGLTMDGDADRFGVADENGHFYSANQTLAMVLDYLIEDRKITGSVVRSLGTTHMLDAIAKKYGITVHETPVGFKHIAKYMMSEEVIIGGEESGGFSIKGHIPEKDGILANLMVAEMCAKRGKPLSKIWAELIKRFGDYKGLRSKLSLSDDKKQKLMSSLKENPPKDVNGIKVVEVRTFDGVKLILENDAWLLVRPSGTEPLVRIYAEAKDQAVLDKIEQYSKSLI